MFQYEELNKQFIGGKWQEGRQPKCIGKQKSLYSKNIHNIP